MNTAKYTAAQSATATDSRTGLPVFVVTYTDAGGTVRELRNKSNGAPRYFKTLKAAEAIARKL